MNKRILSTCILVAYGALLIRVMVFKDVPIIRMGSVRFQLGGTHAGAANLVPLRTILPYLLGKRGSLVGIINLVGNIVLPVPVGFLASCSARKMTWKTAIIVALFTGLAIETMQAVFRVGIFDIDDIILNGLGVLVGFRISALPAKRNSRYN